MAESFDYVAFARDFEKRHGRPPTAEELEKANVSVATVITSDNQKIDFRMVDSLDYVEGYKDKSSFGERLKTGLSFVTRNFFRALLILIQTPVYLTLFFFNLIKSTIGVFVIWFVSKFVVLLGLSLIGIVFFDGNPEKLPLFLRLFAEFLFGTGVYSEVGSIKMFPNPIIDAWIIGIIIVFLALAMTFSKTEA